MQLFYTPDITSATYTLDKEESMHCIRVLRLKEGSQLHLTDGKGNLFKAHLITADPKACVAEIIETIPNFGKRNFQLHIAIAPTKNIDRFEWFLEKATEIGIDEITPVFCEHSERNIVKPERLHKIITSAMKQSLKAYHPVLNDAVKLQSFLKKDYQAFKCIAHCEEDEKISLQSAYPKGKNALILIGPEGDFSTTEIKNAIERNYQPVSLGNSRLRTETAGVVACHTINLLNE
ncbi:MAG: 16S rRNA (uracil(1498)-N(3))-methyltransferase [Bacteroidetes bacterium]|nr:16S rRNA (uracil(1498)-N(3))-methyltransferase [Bacteroidota bacterium]